MKRVFLLIVIPALLVALGFAQASPPVCSPTSGVAPLTVTCTTSNQGGTLIPMMCYNFTGSPKPNNTKNGCTTGTLYYTGPISVTTGETLYIVAGALVYYAGVTQQNIDDDSPGAWPTHSTGWKSVCILPGCNPGGTVPPTSTTWTIDNASPALRDNNDQINSMHLSLTSPSGMASTDNAEVLVTYIAGTDENSTNFESGTYFYAGTNIAKANANRLSAL